LLIEQEELIKIYIYKLKVAKNDEITDFSDKFINKLRNLFNVYKLM